MSSFLFLMISGSESGCLGHEKHGLGKIGIAKTTFVEVGILMIAESIVMTLGDIGTHFPDFGGLGDQLET